MSRRRCFTASSLSSSSSSSSGSYVLSNLFSGKSSTNTQLRTWCLIDCPVLQPRINSAFTFTHQKRSAFLIKAEQHQSLTVNINRKAFAVTCRVTEVDLPVELMTSAAMNFPPGLPVQSMASLQWRGPQI